jgi:hypothetical protein
VLLATEEISRVLNWYAHESQHTDKVNGPIAEVKRWVEKQLLNAEIPASISFISLRFPRRDVATWMSNTTARTPLLNISFVGFIQSSESIALDRLHRSIPDAIWNNIGGKLSRSVEYKNFCDANKMYEYCSLGSPAVDVGGLPKAKPSVCVATVRPDR